MLFVVLLSTLLFPTASMAYLDPGTGSMMLQLLIGSIAAGLYTLKLYWQRLKFFVIRLVKGEKPGMPTQDEDADT